MSDMKLEKLYNNHIITIRNVEYQLRKVTREELFDLRIRDKPGIVFKKGNELYYSELPNDTLTLTGERKWLYHLCSSEYECCTRLSAAPNPEGCEMIRDRSFGSFRKRKKREYMEFLCNISMRIEKYPYIEEALETFGMKEDSLKILKCTHCSKEGRKNKRVNPEAQNKALLALVQNVYPEIDTIEKLREKLDVIRFKDDIT